MGKKHEDYENAIRNAKFDFSGKLKYLAIYTNPFFFVRYNLYKNILYFSKKMKGKVLDFGCGAKPYQQLFTNCTSYIGCDIMASGHNHDGESIDVYYDGVTLPFENESFDSLFSSEVFEHVGNLEIIIPELRRVLKKGGYALFTVPFIWNEHEIPYDFKRYTSFGIKKELEKYGFLVYQLRKSTSYVEMIFQMIIEYLRGGFAKISKNGNANIVFQRFVITPITVMGIFLSQVLPRDYSAYGDNIILCKKK